MRATSVVFLAGLLLPAVAWAQEAEGTPTQVMVRAVSHDAKVIGDGVGGARIMIRDVASGEILARGLQQGESGDTERIMILPHERGAAIYDTPGTAGFLATVTLARPTVVEVIAEGPLGAPHALQRASKTLLLIPGQDILGEGVLLEIHGFIVQLLAPAPDAILATGEKVEVRARVRMA